MAASGIGCLIVYGRGVVGGYGNFTALSGLFPNVKGQYLLVPVEGPVILAFESSEEAEAARRYGRTDLEVLCADGQQELPAFVGTSATRLCQKGGSLVVGIAGSGRADAGWRDHSAITATAGPVVDCTPIIDEIRAVPVEVDRKGLSEVVGVLDRSIATLETLVQVGMSEWEVAGIVEREIRRMGMMTSLVFVSAGPYWGQLPQNRQLGSDDIVTVMVEAASQDGYWAEIGTVFVGPGVRPGEVDRLETWLRVVEDCEGLAATDIPVGRIAETMLGRLSAVAHVDPSGLGHGVGIDEGPPAIRRGSDATLRPGSAVALHPTLGTTDRTIRVSVANTIHVTAEGAAPMSAVAHSIRRFA
jgi:Xaa-Pro aminopeptidase